MFLPQSYLVNLTLEASFEGLEHSLEQLLGQIFGRERSLKRDDTYQLLWELGSNVLKYGIKTKSSAKINTNSSKKYGENLTTKSKQNLDSAKIQAFICNEFIQISLHYLVGKNLANLKSSQNNNALVPTLAQPQMSQKVPRVYLLRYDELKSFPQNLSAKNLPTKNLYAKNLSAKSNNLDCQNLLGNKVIAYLVDKICYDTPKIFLPNARERTLRVRLKP